MHGLRWSGKRRGDVAGAAQILCAAELCGQAARVWSGGCGGGGVQGVRLRAKKRGCRGSRRAGLREGIPGRFAGDLGAGVARSRKGRRKKGADRWARGVGGSGHERAGSG